MSAERPDSTLGAIFWEYDRQVRAAGRHAAAEGNPITARTVLESYDRTLHPWMHGRRPGDLAERARKTIDAATDFLTNLT